MLLKSTLSFVFIHTSTIQDILFALVASSGNEKPILKLIFSISVKKKKKIETTMWVLVYISTSNTMFFPGKALSSTVELEFSRP